MNIEEVMIDIPAEHEGNVFGQFDSYVKKIEQTLKVSVISRDGVVKILGSPQKSKQAANVLKQLLTLSIRGNTIQEQNVDYALALSMEGQEEALSEIDRDLICHTISGKPVKSNPHIASDPVSLAQALPEQVKPILPWLWPSQLLKIMKSAGLFSQGLPLKPAKSWGFFRVICKAR